MPTVTVSNPLPLSGARNVRDLGGYSLPDGGSTAAGVFLRADGLHSLSEADWNTLIDYGVGRVVDLRGVEEANRQPDQIPEQCAIRYFHVPLLDQMNSSAFRGPLPGSMGELYCSLLDNSAADLGRVMELLAQQDEGAALFHCSAGKDRTGVIAMLLLKLAGVPDAEVIEDYSVSEIYMNELFAQQRYAAAQAGFQIPDYMLQSRPEEMIYTLEHLQRAYGSAEAYCTGVAGCSPAVVAALRERLRGKML